MLVSKCTKYCRGGETALHNTKKNFFTKVPDLILLSLNKLKAFQFAQYVTHPSKISNSMSTSFHVMQKERKAPRQVSEGRDHIVSCNYQETVHCLTDIGLNTEPNPPNEYSHNYQLLDGRGNIVKFHKKTLIVWDKNHMAEKAKVTT